MQHLDEGMIHALLDGEIPSAELPPIQAHLGACAECRARLAEEQDLLATSDRLIELIEVPAAGAPARPKTASPAHRTWPRNLAWAATLALAAGLGYSARRSEPARQVTSVPDTVFVPQPRTAPEEAGAAAPREELEKAAQSRRSGTTSDGASRQDQGAKLAARDAVGGGTRERKSALDSVPAAPEAARGNVAAAAAAPASKPESLPPRPAAPPPATTLGRAANRLGAAQPQRLEETVVTNQLDAAAAAKSVLTIPTISFPEAVRRLGGSLRLIEGLVPDRLETLGGAIRVVYLTRFGDLVLSQQLDNGTVQFSLIAPRGFPADSLERLRLRVRE